MNANVLGTFNENRIQFLISQVEVLGAIENRDALVGQALQALAECKECNEKADRLDKQYGKALRDAKDVVGRKKNLQETTHKRLEAILAEPKRILLSAGRKDDLAKLISEATKSALSDIQDEVSDLDDEIASLQEVAIEIAQEAKMLRDAADKLGKEKDALFAKADAIADKWDLPKNN